MRLFPEALNILHHYPQFILWRAVWDKTKNKYQKKPLNPLTLKTHSPHDPAIWLDVGSALAELDGKPDEYGLGFVFTDKDPYWFLDIDNCAHDGQWNRTALELLSMFQGAAVEVSHSGQGLHIFGTGKPITHSCRNQHLGLEFYTSGRFVALSLNQCTGDISKDFTEQINTQLIPRFFPAASHNKSETWTDAPCDEWDGPADDAELIKKILSSKKSASGAFGKSATFEDLWNCHEDNLSKFYPPQSEGAAFDHSSADSALCLMLAFWTGKDCERIDRIFRQSGLYRDKWDRDDYRENTILRAISLTKNVYSKPQAKGVPIYTDQQSVIPSGADKSDITYSDGLQYLSPTHQEELFAGCVYVGNIHRAMLPDGTLLRPEQFRAHFGGYIFALDSMNDKVTRNAWEAFTESQAIRFRKVHAICFRPEIMPGAIIHEEGRALVNSFFPARIESKPGDPGPFLKHLGLLFPDVTDREIITSYMSAIVQYPGVKFQWAPLIQGCEGNGKTLLLKCVAAAVGTYYTHYPNAADLGGNGAKFNSWLQNKLFIGIEEIDTADKREVADAMKPLITNDRIEFQGKGVDQVTGDNRANFMLCSNHKDAIRKHQGDRRYSILYTAQQSGADLYKAGMTLADGETPTNYFPNLWAWLKSGGFAIVTHYLKNYSIPEKYNPAGLCVRAPRTSSTDLAISSGLGPVEQEIIECIEQGVPGFKGGWVSSIALTRLLNNIRKAGAVPPNKRGEMMEKLGYIHHPGLWQGRVNNTVPSEGGKPRLYVREGTIQARLTGPQRILDAYIKAQEIDGVFIENELERNS